MSLCRMKSQPLTKIQTRKKANYPSIQNCRTTCPTYVKTAEVANLGRVESYLKDRFVPLGFHFESGGFQNETLVALKKSLF